MRIGIRLGGFLCWVLVAAGTVLAADKAAERVQPVPLGGTREGLTGDRDYGVYVPTKFGGELTIKVTEGTITDLKGPDGRERRNGHEVGMNQQGWYTFRVKDAASKTYTVETVFVQVGESIRKPWNFYYWPTKADSIHEPWAGGNGRVDTLRAAGDDETVRGGGYIPPGQDIYLAGPNGTIDTLVAPGDDFTWFPNTYDDLTMRGKDGTIYATPAPLLKYDQIFGTTARRWEAIYSQNKDIQRWPGHCLGGATASILLNEPMPAPGSGMTKDELKALWAELGENHLNHRIGDYANEIPPGPPRPGYDECDRFVPRVHAMFEKHLRGEKKALLGNLRAFPPRGTTSEVWNHGIGKYTATYHAIPGRGERAVRLEMVIEANSGSCLNGQDDKPRVNRYEYTLVYGLDGAVDESANNPSVVDWISVGGDCLYAPLNILELVESRWAGHNPMVTEANVRALDMANGGGGYNRRLAGAPPQFRSVASYETGREFAFGGNRRGFDGDDQPRRGLFRTLFGGGR
jgi:hypothetical protein